MAPAAERLANCESRENQREAVLRVRMPLLTALSRARLACRNWTETAS